jgi:phosphate transport system ATP-binding protein
VKPIILESKALSVFYGPKEAVKKVTIQFRENEVAAVIGPSGCGKSTYLRSLNRMNEFIEGVRVEGEILFRGNNLNARAVDPADIRRKIGMVFQKPNPFPKSIYANIVWGPKINGYRGHFDDLVEQSLRRAALWDEVKDRLHDSALALSGGQQQRLCIARAIAMSPEVILMDEPCSALDPRATARIEDLINELRAQYSIVIVTHNMQQAARVSDVTHFFYDGDLVESADTKKIFTNPREKRTEDYITGRFG